MTTAFDTYSFTNTGVTLTADTTYWIHITLDNLPKMLEYFGYTYDKNLFIPRNVSNKIRGKLDEQNKDRIIINYSRLM